MRSISATSTAAFSRLLFITGEAEKQKRYRQDRLKWARLPCEHFEARPISQQRGIKPAPGELDEDLPDEG